MTFQTQPNGGQGMPTPQPQFTQVPPGQPTPQGAVPLPPGFQQPPAPAQVLPPTQGTYYGVDQLPPVPQPPQPQQGQQPQPQPQVPQAPQAPGTVQITGQTRLDGPDIPPELRGRTMSEVVGIYRGLARLHAGPSPVPQPGPVPQAPQPQPMPTQASQMQQASQPGQQPTQLTASDFFRNPAEAIRKAVQEVVATEVRPALAPVQQQALLNSIQAARVAAANQIGLENFQRLEPVMQELLVNADPQALASPQMWLVAAQTAAGRLALAQQIGSTQQPQQQPAAQQPSFTPAGAYPAQFVGPNGQPLPNVNSFFSEQPGQAGAPVGAAAQLQAHELEAARLMDMTPEQYLAWKGGVQRGGPQR